MHSLARASTLSVSFSEAVIPDQGMYGTLRRVCGNRVLGPSLHVLILLPQVGVGVACPRFFCAPWGRTSAPNAGAKASSVLEGTSRAVAPQRKRKTGSHPALFSFCTCCSISESVQRVEFALFISGIIVSLPESLWLPPWVHKGFCKGQWHGASPWGLEWNSTPWCGRSNNNAENYG